MISSNITKLNNCNKLNSYNTTINKENKKNICKYKNRVFNAYFNLKISYFTEDDWEIAHRKLAGIQNDDTARTDFDDWLRKKGLGSQLDDPKSKLSRADETANGDDSENELDREEVLSDYSTTQI